MAKLIPIKEIKNIIEVGNEQYGITYVDGTSRLLSLMQHLYEQDIGRELMPHERVFSKDGWNSGNYKLENIGLHVFHPEYPLIFGIPQIAEPYVFKRAHKYLNKISGRMEVKVIHFNNKITGTSYSRHLMQVSLGRHLTKLEEVDHIDNDKTNDSIGNLQILSRRQNTDKAAAIRGYRSGEEIYGIFECPYCRQENKKIIHETRNRKLVFCNKKCMGKYYKNQRFPNGPKMIALPCTQCGKPHERKLFIYNSQIKQGITKFFCSDLCFRASKRKQ